MFVVGYRLIDEIGELILFDRGGGRWRCECWGGGEAVRGLGIVG